MDAGCFLVSGYGPAETSSTWNTGAGTSPFWASWVFDNATGHVTNRVDGNAANVASPTSTRFEFNDTGDPNAVSGSFATFDSYSRPLQTFDGDAAGGTLLNSTAYVTASPNLGPAYAFAGSATAQLGSRWGSAEERRISAGQSTARN